MTPTPLGDRLETFPLDVQQSDVIEGKTFTKSHRWEALTRHLTTTAKDPSGAKPDFVTERWIDGDGRLNQVTSHNGVAFTRLFDRD
mmetsp:Transcript_21259/g.50706  ORF Transcript_21259/g.50706 Transcript_21259/m.50706 type:complete len:86 (-) Transcript_21259:94-351(-)